MSLRPVPSPLSFKTVVPLDRLDSIGYDDETTIALRAIVGSLASFNLPLEKQERVLKAFSELGLETLKKNKLEEYSWGEYNFKSIPGNLVRIKKDAYSNEEAHWHNGLVGVISNIANNRVLVRYIGYKVNEEYNHPIQKVEVIQ